MNITSDSPRLQNAVAVGLIFAAVFLLFRGLFLGEIIATNDISTNDLLHFYLPVKTLYAEALREGELLQWTPLIYGGFPLFAEGQGGFLYPVNLVIWYILSPVAAMNTYIILHAFLMGLGVYLLTSKLTGNKLYSIPSATAAAICGSIIAGHTRHLNSLTAIVFGVWLFYIVELFLRTRKISIGLVFGMLLGFMFLGGHPQHSFISGFFAVLYLFLRIYFEKKSAKTFLKRISEYKVLYFLLISIGLSLIVSFPQIISTTELIPFTERGQELTSEFTGHGSLPFSGLLTFIYPYYMGNAGDMTFKLNEIYFFWEFFYYSGLIIFALAIYGTIAMWKRSEYMIYIRPLVVIAVLSYILALGENLPLYKIFSLFPVTKSFRFPARWMAGTELAVLVLSGFGVLALSEYLAKRMRKDNKDIIKPEKKAKSSKTLTQKVFKLPLNAQYRLAVILTVVVTAEIFLVAGRQVATADAGKYLSPPSFVSKLRDANKPYPSSRLFTLGRTEFLTDAYQKSRGWEGSHDLYSLGNKLLPPDLGAYFHAPIIDGYQLLVPSYIYTVWGNANNSGIVVKTATLNKGVFLPTDKFLKLSRLFGVKYLTSPWNIPAPYTSAWDSAGVKLYELPENSVKTWVVSKVEGFTSDNDKLNAERLIDEKFDPWASAYVNGGSPVLPGDSKNGTAEILNYSRHSLTIKANEPGFVVLNDTWYPRWKAYIDGNEVPVYRTNVMMRGVVSPKAGTVIEFRFDTGNTGLYIIISYIFVILSVGYLVFEKRKSKPKINI